MDKSKHKKRNIAYTGEEITLCNGSGTEVETHLHIDFPEDAARALMQYCEREELQFLEMAAILKWGNKLFCHGVMNGQEGDSTVKILEVHENQDTNNFIMAEHGTVN